MIKNICRLTLLTAFIFLTYINSYAFEVALVPDEVIPGDVFLLRIQSRGTNSATARFLDITLPFHKTGDGELIAIVPVDVNTKPGAYKVTVKRGKEKQSVNISVKSHEFKTIKLTLPEGKVTLSPENQERAVREAGLLNKIWPQNTSKVWSGNFISPTGTETSTEFGVKRIMNEKKTSVHRGMDFRGKAGTPVKSINSGTVALTQDLFFGGNTLIVNHGMGLYSVYMHLRKFNVSEGDKVSKEQIVGFVGSSGRATGPHLHMSVKLNGVSVNPESLFKLKL